MYVSVCVGGVHVHTIYTRALGAHTLTHTTHTHMMKEIDYLHTHTHTHTQAVTADVRNVDLWGALVGTPSVSATWMCVAAAPQVCAFICIYLDVHACTSVCMYTRLP